MSETVTEIPTPMLSTSEENDRLQRELAVAQARIEELMAQLELANGQTTRAGEERPGFLPAEALLQRLEEELDRARRYDKQMCIMLFAIDNWEVFRRKHMPDIAANVLRATGRMISQFMRRSDLAAAYNDDHFLIVMPETGVEGAQAFGERLCHAVEALQVFDENRARLLLRASGGVVLGCRDTLTRDSMLILASDALRQVQRAGGGSTAAA